MKKQVSIITIVVLYITQIAIASSGPQNITLIPFEYQGKKCSAIYRKDIFEYITGTTEQNFVEHFKKNKKAPKLAANNATLRNQLTHSPSMLKDIMAMPLNNQSGKFSIIKVDVIKNPELRHLVDIGALQAENPDAVFQIASRPNGLEGHQIQYQGNTNNFDVKKNGFNSIIGKFAVQGEEAQISCPILGIHKIYYEKAKVNYLESLGIEINEIGNIVKVNKPEIIQQASIEELSKMIKVSCWTDVPVTTGYANVLYQSNNIEKYGQFNAQARGQNADDANILLDKTHKVTHINVTAIDLDPNRESMKNLETTFGKNSPDITKLAKAALRAAYFTSIYCAVIQGQKKLFLTLPGCGSFKNELAWITEIFQELLQKNIIQSSGLDITLVALEANENLEKNSAWKGIETVAEKTGGSKKYHGTSQKLQPTKSVSTHSAQPTMQPSWWYRYRNYLGIGAATAFITTLMYYLGYHRNNS